MRVGVALLLLVLLAPGAEARLARDFAEEPLRPDQAAETVLAAFSSGEKSALSALAAREDPDPWLVADLLLASGAWPAAEAFATAAGARPADARLPAYVASQRGRPALGPPRRRIAAAHSLLRQDRAEEALAALAPLRGPLPGVPAVQADSLRARALGALRRPAEAAAALERARKGAEDLGWTRRLAEILQESGEGAFRRADYAAALSAFQRRLEIEEGWGRGEGGSPGEGELAGEGVRAREGVLAALRGLSLAHGQLGHAEESLSVARRALRLAVEAGDARTASLLLGDLCALLRSRGAYAEALDVLERALDLREGLADGEGLRSALGELGVLFRAMGDPARALHAAERSLALAKESGDADAEAVALHGLGLAHDACGEFAEARECLAASLAAFERRGNQLGTARALLSVGLVRQHLGDYAGAIAALERGLSVAVAIGSAPVEALTVAALGQVHGRLGDRPRAREMGERALDLSRRLSDEAGVARALAQLGALDAADGDDEAAVGHLREALALQDRIGAAGDALATLCRLGGAHARRGEAAEAEACFARAEAEGRRTGSRRGQLLAEGSRGAALLHAGRAAEALEVFERALPDAERLGATDEVVRLLSGAAAAHLRLGRPAEAADLAARALLEMPLLLQGQSEEQAALVRENLAAPSEVGALAALRLGDAARVAFFLESGRAGAILEAMGGREALHGAVLPEALREAEAAARAAETAARERYQRAVEGGLFAEKARGRAELDAAQARRQESIGRIQREAKAEADVLYPVPDALDVLQRGLSPEEALVLYGLFEREGVALVVTRGGARQVGLPDAGAVRAACDALLPDGKPRLADPDVEGLRRLVVDPLGLPPDVRRVLVSPAGALSEAPFALLLPDREVALVPSGTTYGFLRAHAGSRGEGVLALGDPVYGTRGEDGGIRPSRGGLARLPATREEAKAVGDVVLLGEEATEEGLRQALLARPRWRAVHLACHGLADPVRPTLSALALTPSGEDDGFLTALEVTGTRVPADLVVLSACETARGKVVRGEGLLGLARAFMLAGPPRVLVSLWKVDDEATAALMKRFYALWNPKEGPGLPTATALRQAQESVRSEERWQAPSFWAAWVLWGLPD